MRWQLLACAVLLAGCTTGAPVACTMIAAPPGVAVTVDRASAATLTSLTLHVCQEGRCSSHRVLLHPGSDTVDEDCDPDGSCSARAVPNHTKVGFAEIPTLRAGPLQVSATADGRQLTQVRLTATRTRPNGDHCPPGGDQASVTVTSKGLR